MSGGVLRVFVSHKSKPQFLTGLRKVGLPALQFGECVLETLSSRSAKGNFERHKRDRVIPSRSHSDIVYLCQLTVCWVTSVCSKEFVLTFDN